MKLHNTLAGAHLRGLTAPQQAALAEQLAVAAGGAAAQLPHGRQLLQGKVRRAAMARTVPKYLSTAQRCASGADDAIVACEPILLLIRGS